jgi:hypothetical protein
MKIKKLKPAVNSSILFQQASVLSEAPRTGTDDYLQLEAGEGQRRALAALGAEDVEPIVKPLKVTPGTIADPGPLNNFFYDSEDDLKSLYNINKLTRQGMLARYNAVVSKEADIIGSLKTLRERLSTLKLYSRNIARENQYVTYSFTDGQQIGLSDSGTPVTYSEEEGALLLPIETSGIVKPVIAKMEIVQAESNGVVGNNQDRSRPRNAVLEATVDGQTHSWFEYERIQNTRGDALRLTIKLYLKEPTIVNRIRIDPVNFGTKNWVKIEEITVQTENGAISIREDISTPTWDADQDPFELSPAASKSAGQGLYTFSPVLAKTIQISFSQNEPQIIENGSKVRYGIGLREIEVSQVPFLPTGEFLLAPAVFKTPVRTIGLVNNVAPYDPAFVTIDYQISTDGGTTWIDISPLENVDFAKKEALTFDTPIQSLILKGKISRNDSNFQQKLPENLIKEARVMAALSSPATRIPLEAKPESYLELIRIGLGCCGETGHPLFLGTITTNGEAPFFHLPLKADRERLHVLVNGEEWPILEHFSNTVMTGALYDETSTPPQLVFGDGNVDGIGGRIPPNGAEVYIFLDSDKKAVFSNEKPYIAELSMQSDKIVETTRISFRDLGTKTGEVHTGPGQSFVEFPSNHRVIRILSVNNGTAYEPISDMDVACPDQEEYALHFDDYGFRNGRFEFVTIEGSLYGTDWDNNKLFFSPANTNQQQMTVLYEYIDILTLDENEWRYHPIENKLIITSDRFSPRVSLYELSEETNDRVINLVSGLDPLNSNGVTVVRGSVQPLDTTGIEMKRVLESEVAFINGATEFVRLQQDNLEGFFSIDYRNGLVFLPPGINFPAGQIRFMYVASEISYGIGERLIESRDYSANDMVVDLAPAYIHNYAESNRNRPDRGKLMLRYNYRPGVVLQDPERAKFYSPVLRDITIVGVGVDPRLSTLESL